MIKLIDILNEGIRIKMKDTKTLEKMGLKPLNKLATNIDKRISKLEAETHDKGVQGNYSSSRKYEIDIVNIDNWR